MNLEPTADAPHSASNSLIVTSDSPASQANRTLPLPYTTPPKSWSAPCTSVQLSWNCLPALLLGWLMTLLMLSRVCSHVHFLKSTVRVRACWRRGKPRPQLGHHLQTGVRSFESISDHNMLLVKSNMRITTSITQTAATPYQINWTAVGHSAMATYLSEIDWNVMLANRPEANGLASTVDTLLTFGMNQCYQTETCKRKPRDKPWFNSAVRSMLKAWQKAYRSYDRETWVKLRRAVQKRCRNLWSQYYHHQVAALKQSNPQKWWQSVNELSVCSQPAGNAKIDTYVFVSPQMTI